MLSKKGEIPRWIIQVCAWLTGVTGIIADYGFGVLGQDHLPVVLYCMSFGAAFALDPAFYVEKIFGKRGDGK